MEPSPLRHREQLASSSLALDGGGRRRQRVFAGMVARLPQLAGPADGLT